MKRLYEAIENGVINASDPSLKDRIADLSAIRDQAHADAERAAAALSNRWRRASVPGSEPAPELKVEIAGHTDSDGAAADNLARSQRRAESVVAWLAEHGIDAVRLAPVGKGESEPVADNKTADGRALNRRVEVRRL